MRILNDFSTSVKKAFNEIDPIWETYEGLVVCGTHTPHDVEEMIDEIRKAREAQLPFLGICFGHQLAAIEWCRNFLNIHDATSEEFGTGTFVVKKRPGGLNVGLKDGETYWNKYEVIPEIQEKFELMKPENYITVQFHPEYQSSQKRPHPLLLKFLRQCRRYTVDGHQVLGS
jgi:CTP synthase (UTP-ammonia lyase)